MPDFGTSLLTFGHFIQGPEFSDASGTTTCGQL